MATMKNDDELIDLFKDQKTGLSVTEGVENWLTRLPFYGRI